MMPNTNHESRITNYGLAFLAFLIFNFAFAQNVFAQEIAAGGAYTLEKSVTVTGGASGAAASAGGTFEIEGAIGQTSVGTASRSRLYTFYPGFWTPAPFAPTAAFITLGGRAQTGAAAASCVAR